MLFDWLVVGHVLDASPAHAALPAEALAKAGDYFPEGKRWKLRLHDPPSLKLRRTDPALL